MSAAETLVLFTRFPQPGEVKTRLIPLLGAAGAAELHRRLAARAAAAARQAAAARRGLALEACVAGADADRAAAWLGGAFGYRPQGSGGLGARMRRALAAAVAAGADRAVLVGTDLPALGPETILAAFEALSAADLVFGPAADGGYYLIGCRAAALPRAAAVFDDAAIPWGTGRALAASLAAAAAAGLRCARVATLADVDRPEDVGAALWELNRGQPAESLSVVIPALHEEALIAGTLASVLRGPAVDAVEAIVVDGGSRDATAAAAAAAGARVIAAAPPRAVQMNAGAAAARGRLLLFLHADTRLPPGYAAEIRRTLARPTTAAGAFRLGIDGAGRGLRLIAGAANLRARWLRLPYGDQGLFTTQELFWRAGGFPPLPIMEDVLLVRRLRRHGRVRLAPGRVRTSARRWLAIGLLRTWLVNQWILAAFALGASPERLAAWYRRRN